MRDWSVIYKYYKRNNVLSIEESQSVSAHKKV